MKPLTHEISNKNVRDTHGFVDKFPLSKISEMLKCLPLSDAAKLSLNSNIWLDTWEKHPELKLDEDFFARVLKSNTPTVYEYCYVLSVILLRHVGPISEIYLWIPEFGSLMSSRISPWISYLLSDDVEDITIKYIEKPHFPILSKLFSCLNLEKLTLHNCILNLMPCFKVLKNLRRVKFCQVTFTDKSIANFIAGCPVLHTLTLKNCNGFNHIDIAAQNLKHLTVSGKFEYIYLRSAKNLTDVSFTLEEIVPYFPSDKEPRTQELELMVYLAQQCRIEHISFGGHFHKYLTAGKIGRMFPIDYRFLKFLQLSNIRTNVEDELYWVIGMLQSCHVIEDLDISFSSSYCVTHPIEFDPDFQLSCLHQIRLRSVIGVMNELKLIKLLLQHSPVLKTMYVKRHTKITKVLQSRLGQELLCYRRASPEASIIYVEP